MKVFVFNSLLCIALMVSPDFAGAQVKTPVPGDSVGMEHREPAFGQPAEADTFGAPPNRFAEELKASMAELKTSLKNLDRDLASLPGKLQPGLKKLRLEGLDALDELKDLNTDQPRSNRRPEKSMAAAEKVKVINRTFSVSPADLLKLDNKYGKVEVSTWSKPEMSVKVTVRVKASSEEAAQKKLDAVVIQESNDGSVHSFTTRLGNAVHAHGWGIFGNDQSRFEINYEVMMPASCGLSVHNQYGNVGIGSLDGPVSLDLSYGNLNAGALSNPANHITGSYGNLSITSLGKASLNVSYGNLSIKKCTDLRLDHEYGNLKIGDAGRLSAHISYTSVKIDRIAGASRIWLQYAGDFNIAQVEAGIGTLEIDAAYSPSRLHLDPAGGFDYRVNVSYGSFTMEKGLVHMAKEGDQELKKGGTHEGHTGKPGQKDKIIINSNYGDVRFN